MAHSEYLILLVLIIAGTPQLLCASPPIHLRLSDNSKTEAEGSSIQVNCSVSMSQPYKELKWELSSDEKPNVAQEIISKTTVALRIVSLKRTNAGQYTCLLIMPDGREEKTQFRLLVKQVNDEVCNRFQFKCAKSRTCLFLKYRCDGVDDCEDGSDEQCDFDPCLNKFRCNNSRCIDHKFKCDHVDNCGDHSDEICPKGPSSTSQPVSDDNTYTWLQITVSSFIAVTLGLVFCISFIVIMVFRNRVRRLREQRIARALDRMCSEDVRLNRHGDSLGGNSDPSSPGHGLNSDQQQFLLGPPHSHYGNIIVNVNNGVQYIPGYDYAILMDVPPPYSEVGTAQSGESNPPPPAYSTLEHQKMARTGAANNRQSFPQNMSGDEVHSLGASCLRIPQMSERCATVHAADVCNRDSVGSATNRERETSHPCNTSSAGPTMPPSSVDIINPEFLQSLLGSQVQTLGKTGRPNQGGRIVASNAFNSPDSRVNLVHLSGSPRHMGVSSQSFHQHTAAQSDASSSSFQNDVTSSHPQTGDVGMSEGGMSFNQSDSVLPSSLEFPENVSIEADHPLDEYERNPLVNEARSLENFDAVDRGEDEYCTEGQNEDGTFLIRKPKHKPTPDCCKAEAVIPLPISSPNRSNADDASNALLNEVSKRDDRQHPKPGHLTVQRGEILLYTPAGILCDPPQILPSQSHPSSVTAAASDSPEAPELIIQNGALLFQTPNHSTIYSSTSKNLIDNSVHSAPGEEVKHFPHAPMSSTSQTQLGSGDASAPTNSAATADLDELNDTLCRKELQFKNGELVLESPKQTPSSQILSHLKGAYAEEEGMADAIEPVVNTKRSGGITATKQQSQKVNSDVVLLAKTHLQ